MKIIKQYYDDVAVYVFMKNKSIKSQKIFIFLLLICLGVFSCKKETIENRENLLIGKWDCIDYQDTITNEMKGLSPVFISNLYETGYHFEKNNLMWGRAMNGSNEITTLESVDCEWLLSDDNLTLSLIFPNDSIERYEIIELTRKSLLLKGIDGFWAASKRTYLFDKK
jgi:hypothetical protein